MFLFCASRIPSTRIPLSPGFARFTRTIPFENPSLSGICSLRSHIPPRLRRGDARCEIKNGVQEGIWSLRSHVPFHSPWGPCNVQGMKLRFIFLYNKSPFEQAQGDSLYKKPNDWRHSAFRFAEREGFEPSIRFWRTHAFQACLFSHSSISPWECKCSVFLGNNGI